MKLVDMKLTKADKAAREKEWSSAVEGQEDYPYGLSIHLDSESMEKLGLTDADLDAGQPVSIVATAIISSDNIYQRNGKKTRAMSLQIQSMGLQQGEKSDAVADMYGE
jgi:hypothetical protein